VLRHLRFSRRIGAIVSALILVAAAVSTAGVPPDDKLGGPAVAMQHVPVPNTGVRDETTMVLVGAALIALGAAVRRAA
jgi:LPXTG-motif cell wall-anchored protein